VPSVEEIRLARYRVLFTAVVGLAILATLVILLTGGSLFRAKAVLYLYVPDGTGLAQGSPVRVDGIQVGKVDSVALSSSSEPNRVVRVTMIVDQSNLGSITLDSTAQPAADTLVGDKFIQITSGKSPNRVRPGAEIAFKGSGDLMTSLDLSQFRRNLDQMDVILTDIENGRNELGKFVMTDSMYRDLLHRVAELESGIRAAANTTSAVGRELYTDALYVQVADPIARIDKTLARLQAGEGSVGQLLHDTGQYDQAQSQLASLRKSIAGVRASEFFASAAAYEGWGAGVSGLIRSVDEFGVSPMMLRSDVYEGLSGMAKELRGTVKEFRQDPRKFLRLKVF